MYGAVGWLIDGSELDLSPAHLSICRRLTPHLSIYHHSSWPHRHKCLPAMQIFECRSGNGLRCLSGRFLRQISAFRKLLESPCSRGCIYRSLLKFTVSNSGLQPPCSASPWVTDTAAVIDTCGVNSSIGYHPLLRHVFYSGELDSSVTKAVVPC